MPAAAAGSCFFSCSSARDGGGAGPTPDGELLTMASSWPWLMISYSWKYYLLIYYERKISLNVWQRQISLSDQTLEDFGDGARLGGALHTRVSARVHLQACRAEKPSNNTFEATLMLLDCKGDRFLYSNAFNWKSSHISVETRERLSRATIFEDYLPNLSAIQ